MAFSSAGVSCRRAQTAVPARIREVRTMADEVPSLSSEPSGEHQFFRRLEELYGGPLPTVAELRGALEELYGGPLPEPQTSPTPPWISLSVKSEYQKLCEELGGPVEGLASI